MKKVRRKKVKKKSRWFLFHGSVFERKLRHLRGVKALSDDELMDVLQRGKDTFWLLRNSKQGLETRVLNEQQISARLGVKITEENRNIPLTVLLSDEAFADALNNLGMADG